MESLYIIWTKKYGQKEAKRRDSLRLKRMSKSLKGKRSWNKGLTKKNDKRVKKSGQKLSNTLRKLSKKGKLKNWATGLRKENDKRIMKISKALSGIPKTKDHKKKISITKRKNKDSIGRNNSCFGKFGSNHPAWKDDKAKGILRERVYGSKKYKDWRKKVFERDNYKCQECKKRGYIEAHHKKAYSLIMKSINTYDEAMQCKELWDINNGKTLCRNCHEKTFIFFGNQNTNNLVINANEVNSGKLLTSDVEDNPEPSPKGKVQRPELK